MRRLVLLLVAAAATPAAAQTIEPRSSVYLFTAGVDDIRSLWVNPAGLGVLPVASIFGEVSGDRDAGDGWEVRQFSFGVHSRSIGVVYQRDRLLSGTSKGTWRAGAAFPLGRRAALGAGFTFTKPQRSLDVGARFAPVPVIDAGIVLRNIGRPNVNDEDQPMTLTGGIVWHLAAGRLSVSSDAIATERHPVPGHDMRYRAGARLVVPTRQPFSIITAFDLRSSLQVTRWSVGLAFGLDAQALAVGSAMPEGSASARLQSLSLAAVARGRVSPTKPTNR